MRARQVRCGRRRRQRLAQLGWGAVRAGWCMLCYAAMRAHALGVCEPCGGTGACCIEGPPSVFSLLNDPAFSMPSCPACRLVRLAADSPAWSPAVHSVPGRHFPSRFREAARTVLLITHRQKRCAGSASVLAAGRRQQACSFADLPHDMLFDEILAKAAYPLAAWV